MSLYRKKPAHVEARKFEKGEFNNVADWCGGKLLYDGQKIHAMDVPKAVGRVRASIGDYVIKDNIGLFSTCPAPVFKQMYDKVK